MMDKEIFPTDLLSRITDLQSTRPSVPILLTRVGVKNVKISLRIIGEDDSLYLMPTMDLFVDLPSDKRGVHLSRNLESLHEILQENDLKTENIVDFCERVARRLLDKHDYAKRAEVRLRSDYVVLRKPLVGDNVSQEPCKIVAAATATRKNNDVIVNKIVGVSVVGFTSCPCTQALMKALTEKKLIQLGYPEEDVKRIIENVPLATHTQRTCGAILVEVPRRFSVNIEDLISIVESSMSGQTYAVLKRPAEASIVIKAHDRARFTEDVVREILKNFVKKYTNLPNETRVFAQAYSQESVHKHDIVAERMGTLGEIRDEIILNDF